MGAVVALSLNGLGFSQPQDSQTGATQAKPVEKSFEVASIKPSEADPHQVRIGNSPGGRFSASGVTLKLLIQQAYDVRDFQIIGGPSWMSSDRYDIEAKGDSPDINREDMRLMLQSLLKERFKFQFHRETKELPIYELVVGKNGHKLKVSEIQPDTEKKDKDTPPSSGGDVGFKAGGGAGVGAGVRGGVGSGVGGGAGRGNTRMMMGGGRGQVTAEGSPVAAIAVLLGQQLGRPVVDKTGLKGNYDFTLEWTPDETQRGFGLGPVHEGMPAAAEGTGPSIFTAIQEQLGLRLESAKGPVETIVIDKVDKPSGN
jgi:uncharacterized protein (TIGR03435 family)